MPDAPGDAFRLGLEVELVTRLIGNIGEREIEVRCQLVDRAARAHVFEDAVLVTLHFDLLGFVEIGEIGRQYPVRNQHLDALWGVVTP